MLCSLKNVLHTFREKIAGVLLKTWKDKVWISFCDGDFFFGDFSERVKREGDNLFWCSV